MAEPNIAENIITDEILVPSTDVMTGGLDRERFLIYQLKLSMKRAKKIDIIVSFLMESGVKMILTDLQRALDRGVKIRILTGNYLGITQPSALYLLKYKLGDRIDIRFYNDIHRSFHPKSYIFHYDTDSEIYIGSSNISRSALTSGIEWNYCFRKSSDKANYDKFMATFEDLFENHSIIIDDDELTRYSKGWHKPAAAKDLEQYDTDAEQDTKVRYIYEPRGAQIEALCALEHSRLEGADKGLIVAATGVGKTYLAAFDSRNYKRILFVAHREEILSQAAESFYNVRQSKDYGFFNGKRKDTGKAVIFASVSTLGRDTYLTDEYFSQDYFDYLIIDEFHHSVNSQYQKIVKYFNPKFMLGLTATPERMDGRNIYEICDYNVPYELHLQDAINKGMLVPFHYYGIYDETDYSNLHIVKGRYEENELNRAYIGNLKRYEIIYKYYQKYASKRALGFCCSREHAEDMAREFSQRNIPSVAVYSDAHGEYSLERKTAIEKLKTGEIRVIFSVDMFNEGVDITNIDMVMFLRPTESPTVFLQQLGRGLRKSKGKNYLNVLDFIGNYEKAGQVKFLLSGHNEVNGTNNTEKQQFPDDCYVDFDMRLIDLFQTMETNKLKLKDKVWNEFIRVKEMLQKVPSRTELFTYMDTLIYELICAKSKENPFKHYLDYLQQNDLLDYEEKQLYHNIGKEFLQILENTNMTKVYKMPLLLAFYNHGQIRMQVTEEDVLNKWKDFFAQNGNWKDLQVQSFEEYQRITDKVHLANIRKNPVKAFLSNGMGFFVEKEGYVLALRDDLVNVIYNKAFQKHMEDIINYRIMDYYQRRYRLSDEYEHRVGKRSKGGT